MELHIYIFLVDGLAFCPIRSSADTFAGEACFVALLCDGSKFLVILSYLVSRVSKPAMALFCFFLGQLVWRPGKKMSKIDLPLSRLKFVF